MANVLQTGALELPAHLIQPWLTKVSNGSAVATLSGAQPMLFGHEQAMVFDIGEAEYVGEGANKGGSTINKTTKTTKGFKFQKTTRWTEEVKYADEDYQLGVVAQILDLIQPALSRALDFGVCHGINPTGGAKVVAMDECLADTTNEVEVDPAAKPYLAWDAADVLVLGSGYVPRDLALDPKFAAKVSTLRGEQSEQKLYPNFALDTAVSELDGHRASVSNTIGAGGVAAEDTGVLGFDGDFSSIRWGIQRAINIELIEYGDPDGQGDLKRNNQIAFRSEVIYGWGIYDLDAFAKLVEPPAGP